MRIEKIICDICGCDHPDMESFDLLTDNKTAKQQRFELCSECLRDELQSTLQRLPGDDFQRWTATVLARREKWKAEYGS